MFKSMMVTSLLALLLGPELQAQSLEFLGITSPIAADSGVVAMTRKCQQQFGTDSRMCRTVEVAESMSLPPVGNYNATQGWVRAVPAGHSAFFYPGANVPVLIYLDAAGPWVQVNYFTDLMSTCSAWSSSSPVVSGFVVKGEIGSSEGTFARASCGSTATGVACCGLPTVSAGNG